MVIKKLKLEVEVFGLQLEVIFEEVYILAFNILLLTWKKNDDRVYEKILIHHIFNSWKFICFRNLQHRGLKKTFISAADFI